MLEALKLINTQAVNACMLDLQNLNSTDKWLFWNNTDKGNLMFQNRIYNSPEEYSTIRMKNLLISKFQINFYKQMSC